MLQKLPTPQATTLWNKFTSRHSGIVPFSFNPSLYNFYQKHFNWKPYYILVFSKDKVCGILPLVDTGKAWVSLPHFSYGGMLTSYGHKPFIIEKIIVLISNRECGFYRIDIEDISLEQRNIPSKIFIRSLKVLYPSNAIKSEKVTSILQLPHTSQALLDSISSNLRRKIKKAYTSGIEVKIGGKELIVDFHKVYVKNIHHLNSLNYSIGFFNDLMEGWKYGDAKLFVAYSEGIPVGSSILTSYNGFYENAFFATTKGNRKEYVSDFLHWNMIEYCIENNSGDKLQAANDKVYSFGRSTYGSGVYNYKNHWPVKNYPIFNYTNIPYPRNEWMLRIWRLLPGFVTKPLGAKLIKHIY